MDKPYIVCYMIMSLDGRIDCPMTEHLKGCEDYYPVLDSLGAQALISGRVTAEREMAEEGRFTAEKNEPIGRAAFKKNASSDRYDVVCDTMGSLLWKDNSEGSLLILTSEKASKEYLEYLDAKGISWIACGKEGIDFKRAMSILWEQFSVTKAAVVGGGHINAGFLKDGLLDEIDVIVGGGIDGRESQVSVFDGLDDDFPLTQLSLLGVRQLASQGVLLTYKVLSK